MFEGTPREIVMQETVMTRVGVDRVLKFAFDLAQSRPKKHLTSATKSNGIAITMPYWDERVVAMSKNFPDVRLDKFHIDILTAHFVQRPDFFDVVVASNLFGDILTDEASQIAGSMGMLASASIGDGTGVYEPIHGSAFDIMGKGLANPIGTFWSAVMMLDFLDEKALGAKLMAAIEKVTANPKLHTRDLGGSAMMSDVTTAVIEEISK
jgi:tartrate dehydrogenase/decarboxylase/D-malate dehydrogenase